MSMVQFIETTASTIGNISISNGQIIYVRDTGKAYLDTSTNQRIFMNDMYVLDSDTERISLQQPVFGKLYFIKSTSRLWIYTDSWVELNKPSSGGTSSGDGGSITGDISIDQLPIIPPEKGGTGNTSLKDSQNALINSLPTEATAPSGTDNIIIQKSSGGDTDTSYKRKPLSALWYYFKAKADQIFLKLDGTNSMTGDLNFSKTDSNIKSRISITDNSSENIVFKTEISEDNGVTYNTLSGVKKDGTTFSSKYEIDNAVELEYDGALKCIKLKFL